MTWDHLVVMVLRVCVVSSGLGVATLFYVDARSLLDGRATAPSMSGGSLFWFAVVAVLYQVAYFAGISELWRMALQSGTLLSLALAAAAWRRRGHMSPRQLDSVAQNLGLALAITDLARVDPDYANELAAIMRKRTAERVVIPCDG